MNQKIVIITGQTATGKTNKAFELAGKYDGEIVNFDSRQIYQGLDIITGKDLPRNSQFLISNFQKMDDFEINYYELPSTSYALRTIKLWLYDIVNPSQHFSSFDYKNCALIVLRDIISRGKTPILVGGTGLYLRHLLYSLDDNAVAPDWNLRAELSLLTLQQLQTKYKKLEPEVFESLNNSERNNPQRLMRKIEVALSGNKLELEAQKTSITLGSYLDLPEIDFEWHFFFKEREELEERIPLRVEKRLTEGAVEEVKTLLKKGYTIDDPGMKTIGYAQLIGFVEGKCSLERAKEEWILRELQYAKRQKTYLKKYFSIYD